MKRLICTLMFISILSTASYAGQWQQDNTGWRYQNDDGTYETGWYQDISGKWYYFDNETTYMLTDTTTPDGYLVSADGVWQEGGAKVIANNSNFDNVVELIATAYYWSSGRIEQLDSELPVIVYYNNEYKNIYSGNIGISSVEVAKDGIVYIGLSLDDDSDLYELYAKTKYTYEDGSVEEKSNRIRVLTTNGEHNYSYPLNIVRSSEKKQVLTEIWIEEAALD